MAIGTTAALIGSAVIGAGASAITGSKNAKAIEKSSDAGIQAQREMLAAQQKAFDQSLAFNTDIFNANAGLQADAFNRSAGIQTQAANIGYNALNPAVQAGNVARTGYMGMLGYNNIPKGATNPYKAPEPIVAPQLTAPTQQPVTPVVQGNPIMQQYAYGATQ